MKKVIYLFLAFSVIAFSSCKKDDSDDNNPSKENKFNYGGREFTIKTVFIKYDNSGEYNIFLCVGEGNFDQITNLDYIGVDTYTTDTVHLTSGSYVFSDDIGVFPRFDEAWFWDSYYNDNPDAIGGRFEITRIDENNYEISFKLSWESEEDTDGYYKGEVIYESW